MHSQLNGVGTLILHMLHDQSHVLELKVSLLMNTQPSNKIIQKLFMCSITRDNLLLMILAASQARGNFFNFEWFILRIAGVYCKVLVESIVRFQTIRIYYVALMFMRW